MLELNMNPTQGYIARIMPTSNTHLYINSFIINILIVFKFSTVDNFHMFIRMLFYNNLDEIL